MRQSVYESIAEENTNYSKLILSNKMDQEQYTPSELLRYSKLAEKAGYEFICTSDHFHPDGLTPMLRQYSPGRGLALQTSILAFQLEHMQRHSPDTITLVELVKHSQLLAKCTTIE